MVREIVLDTETTGLDPNSGHRLIELGCIELVNHFPTGQVFHHYIDPERDVPADAERVHGISTAMVKGKPLFSAIADDFMAFFTDVIMPTVEGMARTLYRSLTERQAAEVKILRVVDRGHDDFDGTRGRPGLSLGVDADERAGHRYGMPQERLSTTRLHCELHLGFLECWMSLGLRDGMRSIPYGLSQTPARSKGRHSNFNRRSRVRADSSCVR